MITATRPVGCPRASMLFKTPACPVPLPAARGHAPPVPAVGRPCRLPCARVTVAGRRPDGGRNTAKGRARAALRTGVHPVGHGTGPVVYWVPGPFQVQPLPARDGPGGQPRAGPRSNLGVGSGRVNLGSFLPCALTA